VNLSKNCIEELPIQIFLLEKLEILNIEKNLIRLLPEEF
jgi:hypothetical protein